MKVDSLKRLFTEQLKDLYSAENQLLKALPKMQEAATSPELKQAFADHLKETKEHVARIERVFKNTEFGPHGEHCPAMAGLVKEGDEMRDIDDPEARDAALICAAQKVEHYEIATYGCVIAYGRMLGYDDSVAILRETIAEEKAADEKLTQLAEAAINAAAMAAH